MCPHSKADQRRRGARLEPPERPVFHETVLYRRVSLAWHGLWLWSHLVFQPEVLLTLGGLIVSKK